MSFRGRGEEDGKRIYEHDSQDEGRGRNGRRLDQDGVARAEQ